MYTQGILVPKLTPLLGVPAVPAPSRHPPTGPKARATELLAQSGFSRCWNTLGARGVPGVFQVSHMPEVCAARTLYSISRKSDTLFGFARTL
eukprot:COSAG06_NODE_1122_length_10628_cov_9.062684_13_plen_92_part_00